MTNDVTKMPKPMSKEEMIDILKGLVFGTFDRTTAKEREALDLAIKAVEQPSVTDFADKCKECGKILNDKLQTRWIPVSERLPKDHENVLIYLSSNRITIGLYRSHRLPFMDKPIGWGTDAPHDWSSDEVISWMPLPQPYKAESEGK